MFSKLFSFRKCRNSLEKGINLIRNNQSELGLELCIHKPGEVAIKCGDFDIRSILSRYVFRHYMYHKNCMKSLNIVQYLCVTYCRSDSETLPAVFKSYVSCVIQNRNFIYLPLQICMIS